ncbi:MAG: response regulator [Euryarchaeota archaeon]|nr:response regulator [Euryarchaeota archaeon]
MEKLKAEKPDLILLDVMMPGMSGWDVLREIKGSEELKSIPVVMLTSIDPSEEVILSKEFEELTDYIIKPCASESLLTKVKNVFAPLQITRRDRAVARA